MFLLFLEKNNFGYLFEYNILEVIKLKKMKIKLKIYSLVNFIMKAFGQFILEL